MPHLNASQVRYLRIFSLYVKVETGEVLIEEFANDVQLLRESGISQEDYNATIKRSGARLTPFAEFLIKYGFPYAMANFLRTYITRGEIKPLLIHSGIFFVSEADRTATCDYRVKDGYGLYEQIRSRGRSEDFQPELKLVIPAGVKLNEVKEFLDENWRRFVQPRMKFYETEGSAPNRRIRRRTLPVIERRIGSLKAAGRTSAQIANEINQEFNTDYTYNNVNQIYYRMRHK